MQVNEEITLISAGSRNTLGNKGCTPYHSLKRSQIMPYYSLYKRQSLLLSVISILVAIIIPTICLADAENIFKENNKAVVVIFAYHGGKKAISQGSGFVVRRDGIIITNYHVISKARIIKIKVGDKFLNVDSIISLDKENDIAILKVTAENLNAVKLGNLEKVEIGEKVYVIGSPEGLENTISDGILSGKREVAPNKIIIQITAPISHGSSGGPVFNKNGEVIGIATAFLKEGQNINFAIPLDVIRNKITSNKVAAIKKSQIENYENTPEYWVNRGNAYLSAGMPREARDAFTKAIQLKLDYADAYFMRGVAYGDLGDHQKEIIDYSKAIQLKPDDAAAYFNRGVTYGDLGDHQKAIIDYSRAIELKPDDAVPYRARGAAYYKLGDYKLAIKDLNKAIELKPDDAAAYRARGAAYYKLGDYKLAIKDLNKVIELKPDDAGAYVNRGLAYNNLGDYKLAIKDLDKAIELKPDFAGAYYNKACLYSIMDDASKACSLLKTAIEKGYSNWNHIKTESDFDNIRHSTCYKEIMVDR
jgi:tetratricopeptide (TPR) repeat protein